MASVLAWLDTDDAQQQQMRELIALFKDESTVDELGIGTIRDTFADALFPATSVLHTRSRYLLFVPWLLRDVARHGWPSERAATVFRAAEIKLIDALLAGGEEQGVIGSVARKNLKRMPSAAYWVATGRLGIRRWDLSVAGHFRAATAQLTTSRIPLSGDPEDATVARPDLGVDPSLPAPPDDLLDEASFALSGEEAAYLQDRIAQSCHGTVFAWLAQHGQPTRADYPWQHEQFSELPDDLQVTLDHARRFHHAIYGAPLLYNLMLAERRSDEDQQHDVRAEIADWRDELDQHRVFEGWDRRALWAELLRQHPTPRPATRLFVDRWLDVAGSGGDPAENRQARDLIADRERRLKGSRSRLTNTAALNTGSERAGLVRFDYRWRIAQSHLSDIYAGLGVN